MDYSGGYSSQAAGIDTIDIQILGRNVIDHVTEDGDSDYNLSNTVKTIKVSRLNEESQSDSFTLGEIWEGLETIDISALKGSSQVGIDLDLSGASLADGDSITVMVSQLDGIGNNKFDLTGQPWKSDQTVSLMSLDEIGSGASIVIENFTIAATTAYAHAPIQNDTIHIGGWADNVGDFMGKVKSLQVEKGASRLADDWYVSFILEIDKDGNFETGNDVFTFTLENVVGRGVYNNMLKALDTVSGNDLENTLGLVDFEGGWVSDGELFSAYEMKKTPATPVEFGWADGAPDAGLVGIVGILVNEGSLIF